ncbi:hypothetical protein AAMO2058_000694400 [Amorphochlora amoebiformis]
MKARGEETMNSSWMTVTIAGAIAISDLVVHAGVFFGGGSSLTRELEEFDFHTKTVDLLGFALARTVIATALIIFIATNGVFQWSLLGKIAVSLCMIGSLGYVALKSFLGHDLDHGMLVGSYTFSAAQLLTIIILSPPVLRRSRGHRISSHYTVMPVEPVAVDEGRFGNTRCRFTILYAAIILVLSTLPIWLSLAIPDSIAYVNLSFSAFFSLMWAWIAWNACWNFSRLLYKPVPSLRALKAHRRRQFRHVVIVPCYLDPIDILFDCIGSLLLQGPEVAKRLVVVVTFEARTPNVDRKHQAVQKAFQSKFGELLIIQHSLIPAIEIPGGCSNKNFALRTAYAYLERKYPNRFSERPIDDIESKVLPPASDVQKTAMAFTCTTCDTDSLFHPEYFSTLESAYNEANPVIGGPEKMCVWQAPVFYNWNLDERPFFNRVTGIMRSMMMLGGLISFNLNPMSIFSYPITLGAKAGFINPRYGVDDIIAKVRWMCDTNQKVPVEMLPVPVISGPTIGTTWLEEWHEWVRQIRRWIVGSSESFHYFLIHFKGTPLISGLWWFFLFFVYYGVLLCSAGVLQVLAVVPLPWAPMPSIYGFSLQYVGLVPLFLIYAAMGVAFIIDRLVVHTMRIQERISPLRNILHWLSAPWVLIVYSFVAYTAILRFVCAGKKMAGHDMAAKEGLKAETVLTQYAQVDAAINANAKDYEEKVEDNHEPPLCTLGERVGFGGYSEKVAELFRYSN